MNKNSLFSNISYLGAFLVPLIAIVVMLAISVLIVNNGLFKAFELFGDIEKLENERIVLETKKQTLSIVKSKISGTEDLAIAVPENNPVLLILHNVNKIALNNDLVFESVRAKIQQMQDLLTTGELEVTYVGNYPDILGLINDMRTYIPLSNFVKSEIKLNNFGTYEAKITFAYYYSEFPETIPSINAPILDLTQAENLLLGQIKQSVKPEFTILEANPPNNSRPDPFN